SSEVILERFEKLRISPEEFGHLEHLRLAYEMLDKYSFLDATYRYASTIKAMARQAGAPEKYNTTITFAFMGLVAERRRVAKSENFDEFLQASPELQQHELLGSWYSDARLYSELARSIFVLPDKVV
ncbi:MAG: hypothetical protein AAF197_09655, partial [Pseudomonadota bacterium]